VIRRAGNLGVPSPWSKVHKREGGRENSGRMGGVHGLAGGLAQPLITPFFPFAFSSPCCCFVTCYIGMVSPFLTLSLPRCGLGNWKGVAHHIFPYPP